MKKEEEDFQWLPLDRLEPNPYQPRRRFPPQSMEDLADSVRQHGIIQPLRVRLLGDGYQIIAGERRWRAAGKAELQEVPCWIRHGTSDLQAAIEAFRENQDREDLDPIARAEHFRRLAEHFPEVTQQEIGQLTGFSRDDVAHHVRLLSLPKQVRGWLEEGVLQLGHGKALSTKSLRDRPWVVEELAHSAVRQSWSVRRLESMIKARLEDQNDGTTGVRRPRDPDIRSLEDRLSEKVGLPVNVETSGKGGKVVFRFSSAAELDNLLGPLGVGGDE